MCTVFREIRYLIEGKRLHVNVVTAALGASVRDGDCYGPLI